MAELDDIYHAKLLELAAAIPRSTRLSEPDASGSAHSKLCGSTVAVDIDMDGDRFANFGQTVKACLLGQAAASVVGREIVGVTADELHAVAAQMRRMLKEGGPPPTGRWSDLATLEPVKDYPARHASTMLVFDAIEAALAKLDQPHEQAIGVQTSAP